MSAVTWSQHPKTAQTISKLPLPNSMLHEKPRGGFHIVYIVYTQHMWSCVMQHEVLQEKLV